MCAWRGGERSGVYDFDGMGSRDGCLFKTTSAGIQFGLCIVRAAVNVFVYPFVFIPVSAHSPYYRGGDLLLAL